MEKGRFFTFVLAVVLVAVFTAIKPLIDVKSKKQTPCPSHAPPKDCQNCSKDFGDDGLHINTPFLAVEVQSLYESAPFEGNVSHDGVLSSSDDKPDILITNYTSIFIFGTEKRIIRELVTDQSFVMAVDFNFRRNVMVWTNIKTKKLYSYNRNDGKISLLSDDCVSRGVALDWLNNHVYFTNLMTESISVIRIRDRIQKTLIKNLDNPRSIALHPSKKIMIWSDCGRKAVIESAAMDGTQRKILLDNCNDGLIWPYGLAIDVVRDRLFYVDGWSQQIFSTDLNGLLKKSIPTPGHHPFGLDISDDWVYWMEWTKSRQGIFATNLNDSKTVEILAGKNKSKFTFFRGIRIMKSSKQPPGVDVCQKANCTHLCLPVPGDVPYICTCPDNSSDNCTETAVVSEAPGPSQLTPVVSPTPPEGFPPNYFYELNVLYKLHHLTPHFHRGPHYLGDRPPSKDDPSCSPPSGDAPEISPPPPGSTASDSAGMRGVSVTGQYIFKNIVCVLIFYFYVLC